MGWSTLGTFCLSAVGIDVENAGLSLCPCFWLFGKYLEVELLVHVILTDFSFRINWLLFFFLYKSPIWWLQSEPGCSGEGLLLGGLMGTFNTLSFHVAIDVRAGIDGGLGNTGHRDGTTLAVLCSYSTHQAVGVLRCGVQLSNTPGSGCAQEKTRSLPLLSLTLPSCCDLALMSVPYTSRSHLGLFLGPWAFLQPWWKLPPGFL